MSWASAVTNAAIVKNAKEKNPAVLYFIFNLLCGYLLVTQLSYVFDGPIPHVTTGRAKYHKHSAFGQTQTVPR